MRSWKGATALVTGAASGIGLALSRALASRGAEVWCTDVDANALATATSELGSRVHSAVLDVRDSAAVRRAVEAVVEERGRIDYLFNNAGIGVGGESHEITVEHYDRILDVNVRGVTNGVAAAYPIMVRQGGGHIVNTASVAGLGPAPLLAAYAMTKHAVVGLSTSLRLEAERHGVRVSALCPGVIDTPLLDSEGPADLPRPWRPDLRRYLSRVAGPPYPAAALAEGALKGVEKNREIIIVPASARFAMALSRLFPGLLRWRTRQALAAELAARRTAP